MRTSLAFHANELGGKSARAGQPDQRPALFSTYCEIAQAMSQPLPLRIKQLLIDALHLEGMSPESIEDNAPLFGAGLGLDSVDALELVVALEKEFGIKIQSHEVGKDAFASVTALSGFVESQLAAKQIS